MKNALLLLAFYVAFSGLIHAQHTIDLFGVPEKNDHGQKILPTPDNHYIVSGQSNNDAALYRYNCNGEVVDSIVIDFAENGSYEVFNDIVRLDDGNYLAAGNAWSISGALNHSFLIRFTPELDELGRDTLRIFNKLSNTSVIGVLPGGKVVMAGVVPGISLDFSDIFCVEIDPNTLAVTDSITKFSYGVDQVTGLTVLPDGNLALCGYSVIGNIFDANLDLKNTAWTRVIGMDGQKIWDSSRSATFKNKYGRMQNRKAVVNPVTGNLVVCGNTFSGDTLNPMDAFFMVFSPEGQQTATYTYETPGSQNIWDMLTYSDPDQAFMAVGDSTGAVISTENAAFMFVVRFMEANGQITLVQPQSLALPVRFNAVAAVPSVRFAYTGEQFTMPYAVNNMEGFVAIPQVGVNLSQSGTQLAVSTNPPGNYSYQWYNGNQQVAATTSPVYSPAVSGTYTVQVVDNQGCKGKSNSVATVVNPVTEIELFQMYYDTICTNFPLSSALSFVLNEAVSYSWTLSDGTVSNVKKPDISFDAPGNYSATLTVTTAPGQFLISEVTIISRDGYFSLTDPIPDLYVLVKNNQGQEVYRSDVHYNISAGDLPYTIPTLFLVKNEFYILEIWDYDLLDADDFLGEVYLTTPTVSGVYATGNASVEIHPVDAEASYSFTRNITVVAPYIVENNGVLTAKLDKAGAFSFSWYKDGVLFLTGASDTYTPPAAEGCYTVKVTSPFVCDEISAPYCFTVGTDDVSAEVVNGFTLAPQPLPSGRDLTVMRSENSPELVALELYDGVGQLIYSQTGNFGTGNIIVPTAGLDLSAGLYTLRFNAADGSHGSKKVVVIR